MPTTYTDPSKLYGAAVALLAAVLAAVVAFGLELTEDQIAGILGVATAAGPLVTAYLIRRKAWAPATVDAVVDEAHADGIEIGHELAV